MKPLIVHPFHHQETSSFGYVLANPASGCCAVVDPVLDYDPASGAATTSTADGMLELIAANGYCLEWILETHVHADHLSAAAYLKSRSTCAQTVIGEGVRDVQAHFDNELGLGIPTDGRQFDRLVADGDRICLGHTCGRVMATPGHTADSVSFVFDDFAFVGDTVFAPDQGTARCDFPGGDARLLFRSVQKLYALPAKTRLLLCHDYPSESRPTRFCVTVAEQRRSNCMLRPETPVADFVAAREARDIRLEPPRLLYPALRANLGGGVMPGTASCLDTPILQA